MKILCDSIVNPQKDILKNTSFSIVEDKVFLGRSSIPEENIVIKDAIALPGLINIHDHLKYSWYERIGKSNKIGDNQLYYSNVYGWLEDLYKAFDHVFTRNRDELRIMFELGLYKQIFSATTTVLNHSRHSKNVLDVEKQYINIVENVEGELVVQPFLISNTTSHPLSFGSSIKEAHGRAITSTPRKAFMIHVSEGNDSNTKKEIQILDELGVLSSETILVHCINTDTHDIEKISENKCSVVWCPYTSNFVIGKTANIEEMRKNKINLCIGTDSSCSGSRNLLAELNYAKKIYNEHYRTQISSSELFDMVTCNPAKALMLEDQIGKIADGFNADIAIVDRKSEDPYDDILSTNPENIIALWSKGVFIYGDQSFLRTISEHEQVGIKYSEFSINGRKKAVIGNPRGLLDSFADTFNIQEPICFDFLPKDLQFS